MSVYMLELKEVTVFSLVNGFLGGREMVIIIHAFSLWDVRYPYYDLYCETFRQYFLITNKFQQKVSHSVIHQPLTNCF